MITQSIRTAAKKMMIDFEELTANINHMGERGTSREELLVQYLGGYIPKKYSIGRGAIIDSSGTQSKQQDCIIYDSFSSPVLLNMNTTQMIPVESVYATIEVKSSLNKAELVKCISNIKSVRSLPKYSISSIASPTAGFVFAFTSDTSLESLLGNIIEANQDVSYEEQISVLCIMDKGLIVNVNRFGMENISIIPIQSSTPAIISNSLENNLMLFYLILMQYLNSIQVSPPNLFQYAEHEGLLNFNWMIPKEHVPNDSLLNFNGLSINVQEAIKLTVDLQKFKVVEDGNATSSQLMDYLSVTLKKTLEISNSGGGQTKELKFYGKTYNVNLLLNVLDIYKEFREKKDVSVDDLGLLKKLEDDLYTQYKM